ncbi:MAG: energy transducer TonB [Gemmatimonadaceae bacterium]|nr:energy transducer TonB [Gemmatimonadaceae bacterium]
MYAGCRTQFLGVATVTVVAAAVPAPVAGQAAAPECRVAVLAHDSAGAPLSDVSVETLGRGESVRTREDGRATFGTGSAAPVVLRLRRLGFVAATQNVMPSCGGAPEPIRVAMTSVATVIAPMIVRGRNTHRFTGPLAGFYERRARGDGYFFTVADIDRRNVQRMADLIRTVPGWGRTQNVRTADAMIRGTAVRMGVAGRSGGAASGSNCFPTVVIDGSAASMAELNMDAIDPRSLAGVEVYVDGSRTPSEFWGTAGQGRCGVVVMWSRSMDAIAHAPLADQHAAPDVVFEPHEVDEVATLDRDRSVPPLYPVEQRRKKRPGEATASFVVLPGGEPWVRDAKVVSATEPAFGDALLEALPLLRFNEARRNGRPVAMRVTFTARFGEPAPAASRP